MRTAKKIYLCLLCTRTLFALFGTGYIHPDEHFQNGELTAGHILGLYTSHTWEWDPRFPVRSAFPLVTTGVPFAFLSYTGYTPVLLFRAERLAFLGLSFLLDYAICKLVPGGSRRYQALILLGSSHALHTLQIRSFSNSLEAIFLAMTLVVFHKFVETSLHHDRKPNLLLVHWLGILFVLGTFTRVSFIVFAFPIALQILFILFQSSVPVTSLFSPLLVSMAIFLLCILLDTAYFRPSLIFPLHAPSFRGPWNFSIIIGKLISVIARLPVAPFNFVSYNLSSANLAQHGLHPRWLHAFVNLPLIVGPGLMWYGIREGVSMLPSNLGEKTEVDRKEQRRGKRHKGKAVLRRQADVACILARTLVYVIVASLTLLSFQPHQEPRFLIPLLLPFVVLTANIQIKSPLFWTTWVLSNVILSLIFGVLHQAGVISSLFHIHDRVITHLARNETVHIVYWRTYMPPRRFLCVPRADLDGERVIITDLAGAPPSELSPVLQIPLSGPDDHPSQPPSDAMLHENRVTYVVAPLHSQLQLPLYCFLRRSFFPHLDLDHLKESSETGLNGLGLGLFQCGQLGDEKILS